MRFFGETTTPNISVVTGGFIVVTAIICYTAIVLRGI